jgi:hypothetical protein
MRRLCFKHIVADAVYLPHGMRELHGKVVRPMQHNKTSGLSGFLMLLTALLQLQDSVLAISGL